MKKALIIFAFLTLLPGNSNADSSGQLITHKNVVSNGYDFWIGLPGNSSPCDSVKIPAVVFLHGRSLCGSDLNYVLRYGSLDAMKYSGLDIPAVIIAPQNPGTAWNPEKLMNVLEWTEDHYPVDTNRVYVLGMSLGGFGTIDFAGTYPDKIAAAVALCGGGYIKDYEKLNGVPLWIIHGYADRAVSWKESQKVVDSMAAVGDTTKLKVDFLPGINHGRLARCFYMQSTYDWLFSHSLLDSTRALNRNCSISASALENAYKPYSGQARRTLIVKRFDNETGLIADSEEPSVYQDGASKYITVQKGDCLSLIARREHTTVARICTLNGLTENSVLRTGKKLRVL